MFADMTGTGEEDAPPQIEKKPSSKAGGKTRRGKRDWFYWRWLEITTGVWCLSSLSCLIKWYVSRAWLSVCTISSCRSLLFYHSSFIYANESPSLFLLWRPQYVVIAWTIQALHIWLERSCCISVHSYSLVSGTDQLTSEANNTYSHPVTFLCYSSQSFI